MQSDREERQSKTEQDRDTDFTVWLTLQLVGTAKTESDFLETLCWVSSVSWKKFRQNIHSRLIPRHNNREQKATSEATFFSFAFLSFPVLCCPVLSCIFLLASMYKGEHMIFVFLVLVYFAQHYVSKLCPFWWKW